MKRSYLVALCLLPLALAPLACGDSSPGCDRSNCLGCCDASGMCRDGQQDTACGAAGNACVACGVQQQCQASSCAAAPVDVGVPDAGVNLNAPRCQASSVSCADQAILSLDLKNAVAPGNLVNASEDGGFRTTVDATAGYNPSTQSVSRSYVYAKFTEQGLVKVPLSDEAALDSMDWDIAFRRFVIRLNGGSSGPSCVSAIELPAGVTYEQTASFPVGATSQLDGFMQSDCAFVADGSGLPSSPLTALTNFYEYSSCVAMTGRVFVVQPLQGKPVKLQVTGYYKTEAGQDDCNAGLSPGVAGGTIRLRWGFLD